MIEDISNYPLRHSTPLPHSSPPTPFPLTIGLFALLLIAQDPDARSDGLTFCIPKRRSLYHEERPSNIVIPDRYTRIVDSDLPREL